MKKIVLLILVSLIMHFGFFPPYLNFNDAAKYATVARNIHLGQGVTTDFIYPEYFRLTSGPSEPWQSYWPPLHPLLLSIAFKVISVSDKAVMLMTSLYFLISVGLIYKLSKKIFDPRIAICCTVFYASSQEMIWYATSGLSEPLFICLCLLSILCLYKSESGINYICAGLTLGLAALTRSIACLYLPVFLILIAVSPSRISKKNSLGLFTLGFIATTLFFKLLLAHSTVGLPNKSELFWSLFLFNSDIFPYEQVHQTLRSINSGVVMQNFFSLKAKIIPNFRIFSQSLFFLNQGMNTWNWIYTLMSPVLLGFFVVSLIFPPEEKNARWLHRLTLSLFLMTLISTLVTITTPQMRYFHPLVPLMIIFATEALIRSIQNPRMKIKFSTNTIIIIIFIGSIFPDIIKNHLYKQARWKNNPAGYYRLMGEAIKKATSKHEIIVTNLPGWGSWYGQRRTIYYPGRPDELAELNKLTKIDALFIYEDLLLGQKNVDRWYSYERLGNFKLAERLNIPINKIEDTKVSVYRKVKNVPQP